MTSDAHTLSKTPPERGIFISFEGCDGSGKTTQVHLLKEALEACGIRVLVTREAGGSVGAEAIRAALTLPGANWDGVSDALLLNGGRRNHMTETILPALGQGIWVISDRFFDSTNAYQGAGRGVPLEILQTLQNIAIGSFKPDLTFVLQLPFEEGRARQKLRDGGSGDRFETMQASILERLNAFYERLPELEPVRCRALNAAEAPEIVHDKIKHILKEHFGVCFHA